MRTVWVTVAISILLAFTPPFVVSYGTDEPFVYQKGGRDPFSPLVTKEGKFIQGEGGGVALEDVVLEGIVWDPRGEAMAMMNGRIVRKGDHIGRFEVIAIGQEKVTLRSGENRYTLHLKLPELGEGSP